MHLDWPQAQRSLAEQAQVRPDHLLLLLSVSCVSPSLPVLLGPSRSSRLVLRGAAALLNRLC
jgi:hypothetical protein